MVARWFLNGSILLISTDILLQVCAYLLINSKLNKNNCATKTFIFNDSWVNLRRHGRPLTMQQELNICKWAATANSIAYCSRVETLTINPQCRLNHCQCERISTNNDIFIEMKHLNSNEFYWLNECKSHSGGSQSSAVFMIASCLVTHNLYNMWLLASRSVTDEENHTRTRTTTVPQIWTLHSRSMQSALISCCCILTILQMHFTTPHFLRQDTTGNYSFSCTG